MLAEGSEADLLSLTIKMKRGDMACLVSQARVGAHIMGPHCVGSPHDSST